MPELGKYAGTVLGAYGASMALLVALVVLTVWQGAAGQARFGRRRSKGE